MTLANTAFLILWLGLTAYILFGGADFGAGFWDLVAGSARRGGKRRQLIEHSISPFWEANHVWLIFVIVIMWTCFPVIFTSVTSTLWIPFMLAGFGIILRGSAFALRTVVVHAWQQRLMGVLFGLGAVITPFFLGTMAGAVAGGQVPLGVGQGNTITSWFNPASIAMGLLTLAVCAYLAAVYLTAGARRHGDEQLVAQFRRRTIVSGIFTVVIFAVAVKALAFHFRDSWLVYGIFHQSLLPFSIAFVAGVLTIVLLYTNRLATARLAAVLAVVSVIVGWVIAHYPYMLIGNLTVTQAASEPAVLQATIISMSIGAILVIPSLILLYTLFRRGSEQRNSRDVIPR